MSLFGKIASLDEIIKRLPQLQLQVEKLEEEETRLERGGPRGSFNRRCQDLTKQVQEQREKLEKSRGGSESARAAAVVSLDDLQRRLQSITPERTSTSRLSPPTELSESSQPIPSSSSSQKLQNTRRPSMYENVSSSDDEEGQKADLPPVAEANESSTGTPPTPAPRKVEPKIVARNIAKEVEQRQRVTKEKKESSEEIEEESAKPPRSTSPGVVDGNRFYVLADLEAAEEGDLSIKKGQLLTVVLTRADGWWKAVNQFGEEGMVPKTYLRHVVPEELDPAHRSEPIQSGLGSGTRAVSGPRTEEKKTKGTEERQRDHREDEEKLRLEREKRELEERRREVDEARRQLDQDRKNQQRELLRQIEEERERLKEEHIQSILSQKPFQIEESFLPRSTIKTSVAASLSIPVACLGDALRADPHLTFECHLTPRLSYSNLAFHDLFWNTDDDKLRKRKVYVCKVIRLVRLESMPNVEFGIIRAALYDQSKRTGRQIVSNVHTIRAHVRNGTWSFVTRTDTVSAGVELGDFIIRSNYSSADTVLLIEASIVEQNQDGFREKSVGIVKIPIMGANKQCCLVNKTYSDYLSDENVFQRGNTPKKTNSRIYFKVTAIPGELLHFVDSMPDVLFFNPMYVRLMYFYRRRAGTVLIRDRDNPMSAEMLSDPLLAVFPSVADQPDLMDLLRTMWTSKIRSFKARSETEQAMDFFQVFMNTVFCIHKTVIMPEYCIWDKDGLLERQKIFKKCVEMLREYKTASRFLLTITSQPVNIFDYSFNLMGPHALD